MAHHQEVSTESAIVDVLNYTHALTGVGSGAMVLIIISFFAKALLTKVREGLVVKEEITSDDGEYIFVHEDDYKEDAEELKEENLKRKENEAALFEKVGKVTERVAKVETTLEIMRDK